MNNQRCPNMFSGLSAPQFIISTTSIYRTIVWLVGRFLNTRLAQLVQLKILLLLYILFQLIKNIAKYKVYVDGMRDWSIFSNSFFKYNSDNLPGLISVQASLTIIELGSYSSQTKKSKHQIVYFLEIRANIDLWSWPYSVHYC